MKRLGWLLIVLTAVPSWAATKMTIAQLEEKLMDLQKQGKSDDDVATQLKLVDLTEEMTHSEEQKLSHFMPGDLSTAQLFILQGRSAFLPPPAADIPTAPAPDDATQKAILSKASDYASKVYAQLPAFQATKTTARFQDDLTNSSSAPGLVVPGPNTFVSMAEASTEQVEFANGVEKPGSKEKVSWGQNGKISAPAPPPTLTTLVGESSSGKEAWERWQMVGGKQVAVFTFQVEKKKSHYEVNYCCFPKTDTASGVATQGTFAPVPGEIQSVTSYRPFRKGVGYHGEIFIDPESGAILRIILQAELKPADYVHQESVRIDYGAATVNGTEYMLPLASFTLSEVVPGGDASAYSVRHMLLNVTYTRYIAGK